MKTKTNLIPFGYCIDYYYPTNACRVFVHEKTDK